MSMGHVFSTATLFRIEKLGEFLDACPSVNLPVRGREDGRQRANIMDTPQEKPNPNHAFVEQGNLEVVRPLRSKQPDR